MRIAIVLVALLAHTASADWRNPYTGNTFNNPMSSTLDTMIHFRAQELALQKSFAKKNGTQPASPQPASSHQPYTRTDFFPVPQWLVVDAVIASVAQTADQRVALRRATGAVFARYERTHRRNNVAYAVAFLMRASLAVQTGRQLDDAQAEQLASTINDTYAQNPQFMELDALDRQRIYETCVTLGGLIAMFDDMGKQDPAWANAAKRLAKQALATVGIQ
jgi:hypothetical protein